MNIELLRYTFTDRFAASRIGAYIRNGNIEIRGLPDGTFYVETSVMPAEIYMPFDPAAASDPAERRLRERYLSIMNNGSQRLTAAEKAEIMDILRQQSELTAGSARVSRALAEADDAGMMKKALAYNIGRLPQQLDDLIERLYSEGKVTVDLCSAVTD